MINEKQTMWTKARKYRIRTTDPCIKVHQNRITFSVNFCRIANLNINRYVSIYFDDKNRKIGFEFKPEANTDDDYKLISAGGGKTMTCCCREVQDKPWVKKVAELTRKPAFSAKQEGKLWVISLCPAFEISCRREDANKIPSNLKGIYRYLNGDEIVYVGRGEVKSRINESQRTGWKFDMIQYSEIEDAEERAFWENHWLLKFKEDNNGDLPIYNMILGNGTIEL